MNTYRKPAITTEALLLAALLLCLFVPFLSETLFTTKGEPREAVVAVSMLHQGNWILPVSFGTDIPYKPPMLAWCIAALGWLNGGVVTEFLARIPSALSAVVMLMTVYIFIRKRSGASIAAATVLITACAFEFFRSATICRVDMLLTAFMVTALLALYRQWESHPEGTWSPSLIAALIMSGAVLTKGPVGMLLPCMVAVVFRWIKGGEGFWRPIVSVGLAGLLSLILPALWYVAAYHQGGREFLDLALEENFGRFTGSMSYGSHEHSVWYNFGAILSGFAPFTLLALIGLFGRPWNWIKRRSGSLLSRLKAMQPMELFAMLAAVLIFVFYCIPKSKRGSYLLPVYPFTAYFLAKYAFSLAAKAPRTVKAFGWVIAVLGILASAAILLVMAGIVPPFGHGNTLRIIEMLAAEGHRVLPPAMCILSLIGAVLLGITMIKRNARIGLQSTLLFMPLLYMMIQTAALPASMNYKSDLPLVARLSASVPLNEKVYSFRHGRMERFYTLGFYTDDRLLRFDAEQPSEGYLVLSEHDVDYVTKELRPDLKYETVTDLGRSGEVKSNLKLLHFSPKTH